MYTESTTSVFTRSRRHNTYHTRVKSATSYTFNYSPTSNIIGTTYQSIAGFSPVNSSYFQFQAGQIEYTNSDATNMISSKSYNLTGYTKVNMEAKSTNGLAFSVYKNGQYVGYWSENLKTGNGVLTFSISDFRIVTRIEIRVVNKGYIYRIWLS